MNSNNKTTSKIRLWGRSGAWDFVPFSFAVGLFFVFAASLVAQVYPTKLGDLNVDGQVDVRDLVLLLNHLNRSQPATPEITSSLLPFANINQDAFINQQDVDALTEIILGTRPVQEFPFARVLETSPASGEAGVTVTRETVFRLTQPLGTNSLVTKSNLYATFGGRQILARCELSSDRRTVTLFYQENLPASARVRVTLVGSNLRDFLGRPFDLDGDGQPGGIAQVDFDTLSNTPIPGTAVIGQVFASEQIPAGTNSASSQTNFLNRPLAGVTITVDGMEETLRAVTDTNGFFSLSPCPAGEFFVHIDGRTLIKVASGIRYPDLAYYPFVGKAWNAVAGRTNNLAGGTGLIYLPLIAQGTLKSVSLTNDTLVTFPAGVLSNNPALAGVQLLVPANSLFSENGNRGGKVGIAPVSPDRLPGPLPGGLEFPLVITVQTDGAANFDRPVPVCFPNLPEPSTGQPLPPGTKNYLYSFDHDKGIWEPVGPMTVTSDGLLICTDEGVGIVQPGWHGSGPPPTGPPPPPPPPPQCGSGPGPGPLSAAGGGGAPSPYIKCFNRCGEDTIRCGVYCTAAGAAGIAVCLITGPGAPLCVAGVVVADAICIAACYHTDVVCKDRCAEDNPPCLSASAASASGFNTLTAASANVDQALAADGMVVGEIHRVLHQINALLYPYAISGQPAPLEIQNQVNDLVAYANTLAGGDAAQFTRNHLLRLELNAAPLEAAIGEATGNAPPYPILYMAEIQRDNGSILRLRGRTQGYGQYTLFLPRDGTLRYVSFYDPITKQYGVIYPRVRPGAPYRLPRFTLMPVDAAVFADFDQDGLPDAVEFVYGTDPSDLDTDGDGVNDGAEVEQGNNPLDGLPVATGVIATADTPGTAVDIFALNDIAVVADSAAGVILFNVANGQNPVRVAQVDTPGSAQRVALAGNLIAVADGAAGLAIIDITDPPAARIVRQVDLGGSAQAVAVAGGIAFVGLSSGQLVSVDLANGTVLERVNAGAAIHDLSIEGDVLFVLINSQLRAYNFADGALEFIGGSTAPGFFPEGITGLRRLFVGGGHAYVTSYPGYDTYDVRNPAAMARVGPAQDVGPNSFKQIVLNGSGLGVAAVGVNPRADGTHDVYLYDASNPAVTTAFLTVLPTPGLARALSIYNGLAYVADGEAGLQVVNYLPYDNRGSNPAITLSTSFTLSSPSNGVAEEGKLMRATASVTDDVQVRNVEFYVDGVKVVTDGNFPFEHRFVTPIRTADKTSFTLRAKATDTGGNFTWTETVVVDLVPDATPPRVKRTFPNDGAIVGSVNLVLAYFSEPIDPATLSSGTFTLQHAGADGRLETGDDELIQQGSVTFRGDLNAAVFSFSTSLAPGLYLAKVLPPIADRAGNALSPIAVWQFWVVGGKDTDQDGIPDDIELALGLDPNLSSTLNDGILDGDRDPDGDGLANKWEILFGYDPRNRDSDGNGIFDGQEDPDNDRLTNLQELALHTNPVNPDTDGDGWSDEAEVTGQGNPLDARVGPRLFVSAAPPLSALVTGPGQVQSATLGTVVASPPLAVLVTGVGPLDALNLGTVVAQPPVTLLVPGLAPFDAVTLGVVIAQPPLNVLVPGQGPLGSFSLGTVAAQPPVALLVPGIGETEAVTPGTTLARPPVSIQIAPQ